jgi:hypothetical protein
VPDSTRFGLGVIGQVAELPRSAVVARFGPAGERLYARARGEETDPFRPYRAPERMAMALPIDPPVSDVEGLRFVLHRLAAAFGDQLEARGAATARARLTLELDLAFSVEGIAVADRDRPTPAGTDLRRAGHRAPADRPAGGRAAAGAGGSTRVWKWTT